MNGKGESGQIGQVHCFRIEASHEINVFTSLNKRSHLAKKLFILHKYLEYIKCALFYRKLPVFYEKLHIMKTSTLSNQA